MTACVNKKHTRRVALAISASLVGALSLGAAAPAVAFAEDGASTQAVDPGTAINKGKLTSAKTAEGWIITDFDNIEFEWNGKAQYVQPLTFLPDGAETEEDVTDAQTVNYYKVNGGTTTLVNKDDIKDVGEYLVALIYGTGKQLTVKFSIVGDSLDGATAFNNATGIISDQSFTYTGEGQEVGFVVDGIRYNYDSASGTWKNYVGKQNFDVEWWYTETGKKVASGDLENGSPINAGNYTAVLKGATSTPYDGSETEVNVVVNKLDLSGANISVSDLDVSATSAGAGLPNEAVVNGVTMYTPDAGARVTPIELAITWGSVNADSSLIRKKGTYTVHVSAKDGSTNVTGSKDVEFDVVDTVLTINYKGASQNAHEEIVADDDIHSMPDIFGQFSTHAPTTDVLDITVYDAAGNVVENKNSIYTTPGKYTIVADVDTAPDYTYGRVKPITVTVTTYASTVNTDAQLYFRHNGKVVSGGIGTVYDGSDVMDDLSVLVKCGDKTLSEGSDYTVTIFDQNRQVVDSITDAGKYWVVVTSDSYKLQAAGNDSSEPMDGTALEVVVSPKLVDVKLGSDDVKDFDGKGSFIPYDGSEHSYYFYYLDAEGKEVRLPDGVIELDHFVYTDLDGKVSDTDAIVGEGTYEASIKLGNRNYALADFVAESVQVLGTKVFTDVPSTHWGAEGIFDAYKLGYMSGYKGTTFFGPLDHLTRAQAAVVLYNMGTNRSVDETNDAWNTWHEHGLAFPDAEQWYAAELGWASTLDIVKGYPDGNYGGSDEVSREQFAIMLRNYAAAKGEDVSVDDVDAALADVKDADTISDWAREAVAWAVENGVMGAEGYVYADQSIERAQAALMVTRYQPEQLTGSDLLTNGVRR